MKPFDAGGEFHPISNGQGLRRAAVRSAGITVLGQVGSFFVQIASTMVLARLLSPRDYGVITMVTTFNLLFRSFGQNGFVELIVQRKEITNSLASNLFWINLCIGMLLTLAFAGSGPALSYFYHDAAVAPVAEGTSLAIGIGCLGWIHLGLLQRAMRFKAVAVINFAGQLVYVIISIGLGLAGWHYWALAWGSVVQTIAVAAGTWLACRWVPSWPRRVSGTGSSLRFAMNVYWHFAFSYSKSNADNLLVGWKFAAPTLGFYKRAYDLFVLVPSQLMSPIGSVAVSTLSRVNQNREQFHRYFLRAISVLAFLGMGIGADFALVGRDLIRVILGPGWEDAGRIFVLFGPGIGIMMLYGTHGWIHLSIGRPERWFRWGLTEFVCTVSLFLLALRWGPSGIALAWTTSYFLLIPPAFWYAGKPIGLGLGPVWDAVWKFFGASAGAGCATIIIISIVPHLATTSGVSSALVRIVLVSSVFYSLYLAGVIALHRGLKPLKETASLLRDLLPAPAVWRTFPPSVDTEKVPTISESSAELSSQMDLAAVSGSTQSKA